MKKIISVLMILIFALSMCIPAFAAIDNTVVGLPTQSLAGNVEAVYKSNGSATVYEADVIWSDPLKFVFKAASGIWNPSNHQYDGEGSWITDSTDVKVTNHSTGSVWAKVEYVKENVDATVSSGAFILDTALGTTFESAPTNTVSVKVDTTQTISQSVKAGSVTVRIKGVPTGNAVSLIENDANPFVDTNDTLVNSINQDIYKFDINLNSLVYDIGKVTKVNRAALISVEENIGLVNKNEISLYASTDGVNYTYVENFSMLQTGSVLYFYNFEASAQYIKLHTTANSTDASKLGRIRNVMQQLMTVGYSDEPILSAETFAGEKTVSVANNTSEVVYDKIVSFTLSDLGLTENDFETDDFSDIRFSLDGKYLPHYYYNGSFTVRVLEIAARSTVNINVQYGNENVGSVSDGNEVFEVQYGTKTIEYWEIGYTNTVATMPNGDILMITSYTDGTADTSDDFLGYRRSTDGGLTWVNRNQTKIRPSIGGSDASGTIVDKEANKVFLFNLGRSDRKMRIITSNDSGNTWSLLENAIPNYPDEYIGFVSYSDGIKLSTADGTGPNVDYVYTGVVSNGDGGINGVTSLYSKNGGSTWQFSSTIVSDDRLTSYFEDGISEETIVEVSPGYLRMYARAQGTAADGKSKPTPHFDIVESKDYGQTWTLLTEKSDIYASNTQPIIESLNGTPVFMWAGNNAIGSRSYSRHPLSFAYSTDNGKSFTGIVDIGFQTIVNEIAETTGWTFNEGQKERGLRAYFMTNPDMTFVTAYGLDVALIRGGAREGGPCQINILNVDDYLYKTKGAYDSFEDGLAAEGWFSESWQKTEVRPEIHEYAQTYNLPTVSTVGATEGKYAMNIPGNAVTSRALHYIEEGSVSFDLYVSSFSSGFDIELQSTYNYDKGEVAPIRLYVDASGRLYSYTTLTGTTKSSLGITLSAGQNALTVNFNANTGVASVTVNGVTKSISYLSGTTLEGVSYATIFTGTSANISIDRFIAIKNK